MITNETKTTYNLRQSSKLAAQIRTQNTDEGEKRFKGLSGLHSPVILLVDAITSPFGFK